MSHSVRCWWYILRSVRAVHRAAVNLAIRDISVRLWCGYRSRGKQSTTATNHS